ncbi:CHAT domain-containing protein [Anabaena azotica]|uniref:CHAT domain-containing protein n=1 Tax=Anabaena azotica TaxID=197653 RepID=UPI0039A5FD24
MSNLKLQKRTKIFKIHSFLRYGILAFLTAILCIFTWPVVAQNKNTTTVVNLPQEQQAKTLYIEGRFAEAVNLLQQAEQVYEKNNDAVGQSVVLSNLALNFQQLGLTVQANQAIENAINILQKTQNSGQSLTVWAQVWDVKGSLQLTQGKAEDALSSWQQAESFYQQLQNSNKTTFTQVNQAQALKALGLYQQAISTLQKLISTLEKQPDSLTKAAGFRSLGDALVVAGDIKQAEVYLNKSLNISEQLKSTEAIAQAHLSLGNLARVKGKLAVKLVEKTRQNNQSLDYYKKASLSSANLSTQTQAKLNQLGLLVEMKKWQEAQEIYPELQNQIANLPVGRPSIYAQVNLAQSLLKLRNYIPINLPTIAKILAVAKQQAEQLQDVRSQSFVLGNLGHLYELTQQWSIAQNLTEKALDLSQSIQAEDIAYLWQWQMGRIFCQGDTRCSQKPNFSSAITEYTEAFNTLQTIRGDLVATNADVQFSFRESAEPVYRRLVDLLLQSPSPTQEHLKKARQVLEALQVAKLQNFLQQACQDSKLQLDEVIDTKDKTAAVIYSMILSDRLDVILKLPNQSLYHFPTQISRKESVEILNRLHSNLQEVGSDEELQEDAKKVYSWLIQPLQTLLEKNQIKTLIFVLDGPLRKIPMAALYDGQQYLVEKYAVSLALGLQVRDPIPLKRTEMKVLAASLTEPPASVSGFSRLENVAKEVKEIKNTGVTVNWIAEQQFTRKIFNQQLNADKIDIVHLATHGQFGADRENTFVLTADGTLKIDDFAQMFSRERQSSTQKIELLILSACQTASGNDQEVMGIAGTTVQAGASSAIASLWDLDDEASVTFTKEFYQHLGQPNINRAEALRLAQLALLENSNYDHPRYWSPYVLVGSWL